MSTGVRGEGPLPTRNERWPCGQGRRQSTR